MNWYKIAKDLPGGKADKRNPSEFDSKQLARGVEIEMEHTSDKGIARDVAMDHLTEFPNYYIELDKMEKKLEEEN